MMILLIAGVLPALLLIRYIYKQDTIEHEPTGLLVKLFIAGGLTTFAASVLERIGVSILNGVFQNSENMTLYMILLNFIVVGISEEGVKHFALRRITWYDDNFNFRFDAVLYSAVVALGFAAFENVLYILNFGLGVAPIRAVTAIPMHCICGIFMGHYYGQSKLCEQKHNWSVMKYNNIMSMLIPVLLHGFYDFAASSEDELMATLFFAYVVIVDIFAFYSVKRYSKNDIGVWE